MSQRAIASATGMSKGTVQNELAATGQNCPVTETTGVDGRTYRVGQSAESDEAKAKREMTTLLKFQ